MPGPCCSGAACSAARSSRSSLIVQQRGRLWPAIRAMGIEGVLVAICSAVATVCFLNAMRLTSVADVMVIDAAIPFITAAWPG